MDLREAFDGGVVLARGHKLRRLALSTLNW